MCGIFAYKGDKNNAGDLIFKGLRSLEYRGYDSWGIAIKQKNNQIFIHKQIGKIPNEKFLFPSSSIGFGHTRWATHGGVTKNNSHPHTDCTNKIIVIHNGIVENFAGIKFNLIKKKHIFKSETDTEVISHLIEEELIKNPDRKKAILQVFHSLEGMNAIIVFFPEYEEFFAIKNGSPIVFGKNNNELIIASDPVALTSYTKQALFLEDNQLLAVNNKPNLYDVNGNLIPFRLTKLDFPNWSTNLGKYPHFMIKEIHEQPKVITNIINSQQVNIKQAANQIKISFGSYLIGCGTAYYAALAGTYLFTKIANRHINASVGSEFSYLENFLTEKSLVIALSQSGETIDIISSLKKTKERRAKIMAITNGLGSTLYRMSDYKILLNAGVEKCVLATKSFTAKIAVLYLISYSLNGGYEKGILQLKKAVGEIIKLVNSEHIRKIANKLALKNHIYILGRGVSYPAALESALKIKEVSYIHAEGFAGGELKHGTIALIEKNTPVIIYNPEDETYKDTLSSAYEVKSRGAYTIGVSSKYNAVYDNFIKVKSCEEATIIPNVVVAQLLGYYIALAKKLDPDKPRNLAKSVTVK